MSEVLWNLMEILYKRGYVEYHSSLYANVLKDYNLEVPGLKKSSKSWSLMKRFYILCATPNWRIFLLIFCLSVEMSQYWPSPKRVRTISSFYDKYIVCQNIETFWSPKKIKKYSKSFEMPGKVFFSGVLRKIHILHTQKYIIIFAYSKPQR